MNTTFNSLSRDHVRVNIEEAVERIITFNSLSRDHGDLQNLHRKGAAEDLSTPSLGITSGTLRGRWNLLRRLSTPSLGITVKLTELAATNLFFQLPLSGSQLLSSSALGVASNLSTPSLGITKDLIPEKYTRHIIALSTPSLGITSLTMPSGLLLT